MSMLLYQYKALIIGHIFEKMEILERILGGKLTLEGLKMDQTVNIKNLFSVKFRGEYACDG